MRPGPVTAFCTLGALVAVAAASAEPRFDVIGYLPGMSESRALAVSADGCVVVGQSGQGALQQAFRWQNGVLSFLLPGPHTSYESPSGISANGLVVVGTVGDQAFRLDANGPSILSLPNGPPKQATAVSADGRSVGACVHASVNGFNCDWPVFWRDGGSAFLPAADGSVTWGAVRSFSSNGELAAGSAGGEAVIWRTGQLSAQGLGYLPGLPAWSEAHGLSPEGVIAVGSSGYAPDQQHAFRWNGRSLEDLGALTRVARATTAGGTKIVGDGPEGAFVWDASHGARRLADVLRSEYGLELGSWQLESATAVTPDGSTIVGYAIESQFPGRRVGWRARLGEIPCSETSEFPVVPIALDPGDGQPPLEGPSALALSSTGWLYVTGAGSRTLDRIETELAFLETPRMDRIEDLSAEAEPGAPTILSAKPGEWAYVLEGDTLELHLGDSTSHTHVFSGSYLPPIDTLWGPQPTRAVGVLGAPGGMLYIAATARVMRRDPDELVYELIDSATASAIVHGAPSLDNPPFIDIEFDAAGQLRVATTDYILVLDEVWADEIDGYLGSVVDFQQATTLGLAAYGIRGMVRDVEGGLWVYGEGLARIRPDGSVQMVYAASGVPDAAGGTLTGGITALEVDLDLNLYYTDGGPIVRRSSEGALSHVLTADSLDWHGQPVGSFLASDLEISKDALFVADFTGDRVLRVDLPESSPTRCANGRDDDGDGAVDFPADTGCVSAEDNGERTPRFACDNGLDDDGDGAIDWPADDACAFRQGVREVTECDDGLDNDADGKLDWNGGYDDYWQYLPPDPECAGSPLNVIEHPWYCGLGFEVAVVVLPIVSALRRMRRARAAARR